MRNFNAKISNEIYRLKANHNISFNLPTMCTKIKKWDFEMNTKIKKWEFEMKLATAIHEISMYPEKFSFSEVPCRDL